jgi:uncharacterized phage protein (TIGR01671 family)
VRQIKYRQKLKDAYVSSYGEAFHYWGYIDGGFVSPVGLNVASDESEQFTGLQDKDGVDIYEGDIQKVTFGKHYWLYVVGTCISQFGNTLFSNEVKNNLSVCPFLDEFTFLEQASTGRNYVKSGRDCEIIGNIHENKELL